MPTGTTIARLTDEFVDAMRDHGLAVDRESVEAEIRARIADIAERLRVTPQAVLDDHAREGWGRDMSAAVIDQVRRDRLFEPSTGAPTTR